MIFVSYVKAIQSVQIFIFVTFWVGIFVLFVGSFYGWAWLFEEFGWVEDNYVDKVLSVFIYEGYKSFFAVEWIRIPIIYIEYLVTLYLGLDEFDPNDSRLHDAFVFIMAPFIWQLMMFVNPFIVAYSPLVMLIYFSDKTMFKSDVYIWEHDMEIDLEEKWINILVEYNPKFKREIYLHNYKHKD